MQRQRLFVRGAMVGGLALAATAFGIMTLDIGPMQRLGIAPGYLSSYGLGANSVGTIVGYGNVAGTGEGSPSGQRPLRSLGGGPPAGLAMPPGSDRGDGHATGMAFWVAENGTVLGPVELYAPNSGAYRNAVVWDAAGNPTVLPPGSPFANGATYSDPKGISRSGQYVVGYTWFSTRYWSARWTVGAGAPIALSEGSYRDARAYAVNDAGVAGGAAYDPGLRRYVPVRWSADGQTIIRLGDVVPAGASTPRHHDGAPFTVLADGSAVGYQYVDPDGAGPAPFRTYAVRWDPAGVATDISPPGAIRAAAYSANEAGMAFLEACIANTECTYGGISAGGTFVPIVGGGAVSESANGVAYIVGSDWSVGGMARWRVSLNGPNSAPVVSAIVLPAGPVALGAPVAATAVFSDTDAGDAHTARFTWDWDLAINAAATGAAVTNGSVAGGNATGGTSYAQAGVYTVRVAVTDDDGGVGTRVSNLDVPAYVVVYDPSAGFVTGSGWIPAAAGDCTLDAVCTAAAGKAHFGFVSRHQRGARLPSGNTEFEFKAGGFRFTSTDYEWLVVAGARAQYKGEGVVHGGGTTYGFLLTAIDGAVNGGGGAADKFRIKVWDKTTGAIVYDNQRGQADDSDATTALGGGSIVIHAK